MTWFTYNYLISLDDTVITRTSYKAAYIFHIHKLLGCLPSRKGFWGSHVAHNCAQMKGVEHTMYITITAIVCFTVLIFALEISGVLFPLLIFGGWRDLNSSSPTELCHISRQMQEYVTIRTMRGIMNTEIPYLKQKYPKISFILWWNGKLYFQWKLKSKQQKLYSNKRRQHTN